MQRRLLFCVLAFAARTFVSCKGDTGWDALGATLRIEGAALQSLHKSAGTLDEMAVLSMDKAKALGMNMAQRARLRKWAKTHRVAASETHTVAASARETYPGFQERIAAANGHAEGQSPVLGADQCPTAPREVTTMGFDTWSASPAIEEVHATDAGTREKIKSRQMPGTPLVIRGALDSEGVSPEFDSMMRWAPLEQVLREQGPDFQMMGVKYGKSRVMSYWMDVIPWLNYRDPRLNKRTRAWHTFRKANMKPGKFFRGFKKPDAPHVYYYDSIPAQAVGVQRKTICTTFAPKGMEGICLGKADVEGTISVWANSVGLVTQAHYDGGETTIFMQIRGKKRFTLWHPADIGNLCMHPHAHPALRQSQADMGEGVGVDCPAFARAHNRSVELGPGDVLLLPPYYVHRIDTLEAAVSMSYLYTGTSYDAHRVLKDTFIVPVMNICKKQGRRAPATLRWLLRRTLRRALGTEESVRRFLAQHWTEWAMLPDIEQLGGLGDVHGEAQKMCAAEARLTAKSKASLEKHATEAANMVVDLIRDEAILHEELKYVLGTYVLIMSGYAGDVTQSLPFDKTAAWFAAIAACGGDEKQDL